MRKPTMKLHSGRRAENPRARARFLTQAIQLEESDAPGVVGAGVFLTALLICGVIGWSAVTALSEVARSPGEVVPAGLINKVQHLKGGIVEDIHVRNRARVERGDRLISLAASATQSELNHLESRRAANVLQLARISALLDGRQPVFAGVGERFPTLRDRQAALYRDQSASRQEQLALVEAQVAQREGELGSLKSQLHAGREELELLRQLRDMRATLAERQVVARVEVIDASVRLAETMREMRELQGSQQVADHALAEARQRRTELLSRLREGYRTEASRLTSELAEVDQLIVRTRDRVERLEVTSPVSGIVKGLNFNTLGSVVPPGAVILEVVPIGDTMIVESRISTSDVGHVHPGQSVDVRVTSLNRRNSERLREHCSGCPRPPT